MKLAHVDDLGDRAVVVNLNTHKRAALSPDLYAAIAEAFELAKNPRIRSVLFTAERSFFYSGGDLNTLIERRKLSEVERKQQIEGLHRSVSLIRQSPVPVIAAVKGGTAGAGFFIAMACDLVVSSEGVTFTAAYVKAGLVPDGGLTSALSRLVPRPFAMEMCLMARPVAAERLASAGAVNLVVPAVEVEAQAHVLADQLSKGPRDAMRQIRRLVSSAYEEREEDHLVNERDAMARAQGGPEAAEGISAFLEKRKPDFST